MYFKTKPNCFLLSIASLLLITTLSLSSCALLPEDDFTQNDSEIDDQTDFYHPVENGEDYSGNGLDINNDEPDDNTLAELPKIGIYSGVGSWDVNVEAFINFFDFYEYTWILVDEKDMGNMDLAGKIDAIIFPGGFAAEYKNLIPNHDNLIYFLKEGGIFIGTCAGAYYASDILTWHGTDYQYPLGFYDGRGIGPLAGQVNWGDVTGFQLTPGHPVNESFNQTLDIYYFDGPYFDIDETASVEIIASYVVNNQPAVIAGRYGEGKYLLFGPHPELGGYSAQSPEFNLHGEEGAQWPWLQSSLIWLFDW